MSADPKAADDAAARQPLLGAQGGGPAEHADAEAPPREQPEPTAAAGAYGSTFTPSFGAAAAYGILVSIVIGSGVFTSPGAIDTNVPSPGAALGVWLLGGILAWSGATTLAELGTAIPGEGGIQPFLKYIYGDVIGFLSAWGWIVAVMPATLSLLSIVFIETIYSAMGMTDQSGGIVHKLLAILVLVVISACNCISTSVSNRLNGFFLGTKFASIIFIVVAGIAVVVLQVSKPDRKDIGGRDWFDKNWFGTRETVDEGGNPTHWKGMPPWELLGHYSAAVYGALWAYSGWDKTIYISAELKNPTKQLPLAVNTAVPTIFLCYVAANAAYYILLPWKVVSTTDSIAVTAISSLMGREFGIIAAVLICLVVAGSILGNSLVASRMTVSAANKTWFPRFFSVVGRIGLRSARDVDDYGRPLESKRDAPINAIILNVIITAVYIIIGDFRSLLTFNGLGEYSFFFLAVLGAIILRYREPELKRPYKPFILIPAIFAIVSGFVIVRGAVFAPIQTIALIILWGVGLIFYFAKRRWFHSSTE